MLLFSIFCIYLSGVRRRGGGCMLRSLFPGSRFFPFLSLHSPLSLALENAEKIDPGNELIVR